MKLSISNIAWTEDTEQEVFELLRSYGIQAIELAPTRIWPDWQVSPQDVQTYQVFLAKQAITCSSLQAILYNRPALKLFGTADEKRHLIEHLKLVAEIASILGARPMVLGAPKNRDKGMLDEDSAFAEAVDLFAEVGDFCAQKSVCLCIEPNPSAYSCNFITNSKSGADLVRAVNSPGFRLHLDAAGMYLAGEDLFQAITQTADVLEHVHISEPYLGTFTNPQVAHQTLARALRSISWSKWLTIEMRATGQPSASVQEALEKVLDLYRDVEAVL